SDGAGNVGTGSLSGDKVTISGSAGMVAAATFTVQGDGATLPADAGVRDLSVQQPPDLAAPLPAILTNITITPNSLTEGTPAQIRINWNERYLAAEVGE